ncbi:MAG: 3-deoxy-8-phosphooctulonate synthase [Chlamydiae bacterium]|nr:3-deoxy-8-phosphooctulonate synthase [Chlamydiota bacterium]MBI3277480.1 3-deoxy-8-phosphooctulonate synthase [Chlamydiota bacterium]
MTDTTFSQKVKDIKVGSIFIGSGRPLVFIAGPCAIESESHCLMMAKALDKIFRERSLSWIFKSSYDKANRTSIESFRGPGLKKGLKILERIKKEVGVPILTDVHSVEEVDCVSEIADIVQIPAFLCRQTDLIVSVAKEAKVINIKKGQFLAPWDVRNVVKKAAQAGAKNILVTERGFTFGYNNLVSDMRSLPILRSLSYPVIFDATHSAQLPGGESKRSGGERQFVLPLARAAVAAGCDGLFMEVHQNPDRAPSDGPNMVRLADLPELLDQVVDIDEVVRKWGVR